MTKRKDTTHHTDRDTSLSRCPICREPVHADSEQFPFCSARCRKIDLGRWVDGDYRISRPIEEADLDD